MHSFPNKLVLLVCFVSSAVCVGGIMLTATHTVGCNNPIQLEQAMTKHREQLAEQVLFSKAVDRQECMDTISQRYLDEIRPLFTERNYNNYCQRYYEERNRRL